MKISTAQEAINGNSNDTVITPLRLKQVLNSKNIGGGGSSGGVTTETDPVFKASPAANITDEDIANWNNPPIPNVPDEVKVGGSSANISSGTDIWVKIAKNLYNQIVKSTGICLTSTGSTQNDYSYWGVSDYIEVEPNTDYVLSGINYSSTSRYMVWYDENKEIISTFARYMPTKYDYVTVKSPANAKYIRFTLFIGASDNAIVDERTTFQFEKGTVATSYMPYSGNKNTFMVNNSNGSYSDFYDLFPVNVESGVAEETDPTVPDYVKQITQEDIDKWNSGTGDGTITEIVNTNTPKSVMTLKLDDDVTCVTGAYTHLPLTVYSTEGDGLTYENGYVKISKGINKVKVSGCAKFGTSGTSTKHIHIDKNTTTIAWALENPASASLGASPKVTPIVVDVVEGDLIDLKYYTSSSGDVVEGHRTCYTYLTVEAVEDGQIITVNNTIDGIPIGSEFEYNGEEVPDGYEEVIEDETEDDTGWQKATLTSYFKPYNENEGNTPVYRKVGKLVEIRGSVSPVSAQSAGWTATMFELPEEFRPSMGINKLCQGSGSNKWLLAVNPDGSVTMARYSGTSNVEIPATAWLIFQTMFFVD